MPRHQNAFTPFWGRRNFHLLAALALLGLIVFIVVVYGLNNHARGVASGAPAWAKMAGILPIIVGLHPLLVPLHPVLVLLVSLGAAMVRLFRHRPRHREQ